MKNLNQTWMGAFAILFGIALSHPSFAQSASDPNQVVEQITMAPADEDNGNPPLPPILNTKINELEDLEIFPNPNSGNFNVKINDLEIEEIVIIDLLGKIIYKENVKGMSEMKVDLANIRSGIYLLSTGKEAIKFKVL